MGLENPTKEIVILTKYITIVYASAYFLIRLNSSVYIKIYKILVDNSIQYNSYFTYSENVIISMIFVTNIEIRR